MKKTLNIMNLFVAVVLSCGWLFPAYHAVLMSIEWMAMSPQERVQHLADHSLPIYMAAEQSLVVATIWLGLAALYWSLRFSVPLFLKKSEHY